MAGITLVGTPRPPDRGGVVTFRTRAGEDVQVAVLPFLTQRYAVRAAEIVTQTPSENVRAYDEMTRQIVAALTAGFGPGTVNLLMSHLTCIGGLFGGGERTAQSIFEYAVPASIFPVSAHYVALGHLHRRQSLPAHCPVHYSGAPIAVDFGEQDNTSVVCLVEATPSTPARVTDIPLTAGRRLRTVRGTLAELEAQAPRVRGGLPAGLAARAGPGRAARRCRRGAPARPRGAHRPRFRGPLVPPGARRCARRAPDPRPAVRGLLRVVQVDDPRVAALFGELHDEVTAAGSAG